MRQQISEAGARILVPRISAEFAGAVFYIVTDEAGRLSLEAEGVGYLAHVPWRPPRKDSPHYDSEETDPDED